MASHKQQQPRQPDQRLQYDFMGYDPNAASPAAAAAGPSSVRRIQRSVTEGRISKMSDPEPDPAAADYPSSSSSAKTTRPEAAATTGTGLAPTTARNGSNSSYFDIYQPYKLNPALTPSLRTSKSKPDLKSSSRSRIEAKQRSQTPTEHGKTAGSSSGERNRPSERSANLRLPTDRSATNTAFNVAKCRMLESSSSDSANEQPSRSPSTMQSRQRESRSRDLSKPKPTLDAPDAPPDVARQTAVPSSASARTQPSSPTPPNGAPAVPPPHPSLPPSTPQRRPAATEEYINNHRTPRQSSPSAAFSLSAHALAGVASSDSTADRAASVDEWRRLAAAAAQKSPGGYTSPGVVAGVTRRKSRNDLKAALDTPRDSPPPAATSVTSKDAMSSPQLWRQRAQRVQASAQTSAQATAYAQDQGTSSTDSSDRNRDAAYTRLRGQMNQDPRYQHNHQHSTCSHTLLDPDRHGPKARRQDATDQSDVTASTIRPSPRAHHRELASSTSTAMPTLAARREALQRHNVADPPSIDDIVRRCGPPDDVPATFAASSSGMGRRSGSHRNLVQQPAKSIDDIIREHAAINVTHRWSPAPASAKAVQVDRRVVSNDEIQRPNPRDHLNVNARDDSSSADEGADSDESTDSITREVRQSLRRSNGRTSSTRLHHATSFPSKERAGTMPHQESRPPMSAIVRSTTSDAVHMHHWPGRAQQQRQELPLPPLPRAPQADRLSPLGIGVPASMRQRATSLTNVSPLPTPVLQPDRAEDAPLQKLTKQLTIETAEGRLINVSFADVGSPTGQPVFVYLGLGAVRYLIGLYDELASLFNLRLICVDRWGLGKTDDVPGEERGLLEWSGVIAKVADALAIPRFAILAHSAGAPYAMATALLHGHRIVGPVHLLAPWVNPEMETGYKWLRYVPGQVIRTAQAAEWRLAGWRLGRGAATPESQSPALASAPRMRVDSQTSTRDSLDRSMALARVSSTSTPPVSSDSAAPTATASTTMRIALPSPVTGLVSPPPPASTTPSLRTPSRNKTSFLGSFFGGSKNAPTATSSEDASVQQGGLSVPEVSSPMGSASDGWTPTGTLSPSMRTDEDTWVASRDRATTPETTPSDAAARCPMSKDTASTDVDSLNSLRMRYAPFLGGDDDDEAEFLADTKGPPDADAVQQLMEGAAAGGRARRSASYGGGHRFSTINGGRVSDSIERDATKSRISSHSAREPYAAAQHSRPSSSSGIGSGDALPQDEAQTNATTASSDLATTLLRASHAESQRGSTNDLLTILGGRGSKPWGFTYADIVHPTRVWHGEKDERIGATGAMWMEREMRDCTLKIVKGANHSLMTNTAVIVETFER